MDKLSEEGQERELDEEGSGPGEDKERGVILHSILYQIIELSEIELQHYRLVFLDSRGEVQLIAQAIEQHRRNDQARRREEQEVVVGGELPARPESDPDSGKDRKY
ncbi:hypothetical protein PG997_002135 [Apiospora hydei]|uniref:Uncharacterized protein n=1 Tax=Apiospora hydei TaxID=1337664 RepID=A0ABR1X8M2_9PEZI